MKEIALTELETWYLKNLKDRFKKEHKVLGKFYEMAEREIAESKNALNSWLSSTKNPANETDEKVDEKTAKIMERFINAVLEAIGNIRIPTVHNEISYETSQGFCDDVKKLYAIYNETGRKSIGRFAEKYRLEIKEIDLHLRKVGDLTNKVGEFMRKNYQDAKTAETAIKRIPRLQSDIDRVGQSKIKIAELEKELLQMKETLKNQENSLFELGKDPELQEFEEIERMEQSRANELRDNLRFKKAFQKLKNALEKGSISARGITESDLRPYLKDPVIIMLDQGPKLTNLKDVLIKTRILLEDEADPLQLKSDLRQKIIENINDIVNKNILEPDIMKLLEIRKHKGELSKSLEAKGLEAQRKELKDKIAILTVETEHFENDLNRRKRDFRDLLEKVGADRDELQKIVEKETGQQIKISVIIPA